MTSDGYLSDEYEAALEDGYDGPTPSPHRDTPGLCDGCDTVTAVQASDDGRGQFCATCLPVANAPAPPRPWRVGLSWGRTIVESGTTTPDEQGRRRDDRLVGVVETRQDAERIVAAVNGQPPPASPGLAERLLSRVHVSDALPEGTIAVIGPDASFKLAARVEELTRERDEARDVATKHREDAERLREQAERLADFLHARRMHPDYEYETTSGPRKAFADDVPPYHGDPDADEGWERNRTAEDPEAWERFDYHEESYWRRPKPVGEGGAP